MLPVLIVSLKKDVEKRQIITKKLNELEVNFEFIDAIYGKDLSDVFCESLQPEGKLKHRSFPLTRGEIGCSLSHVDAYKKILACEMEWACILEDDAILDERFNIFIHGFNGGVLDIDNLYILGGQEGLTPNKYIAKSYFKKVKCGNQVFYKINNSEKYVNRTCCYVINLKIASKMIDLFEKGFYLADDWRSFSERGAFKYIYLSNFVAHPLDLSLSSIEQERQEGRGRVNLAKKSIFYLFVKKTYLVLKLFYTQLKRFY